MTKHSEQSGFTAVELLITLFVAAAFLVAGYQLFNVVIKDGGQTRSESRAANVAYDYMRQYSSSTTIPCTASTPLNSAPVNIAGLTNATVTVAISCLPDALTSLSKIDVTVSYNSPAQTVKYSTFSSAGGASNDTDVTEGLIAWWKFNGDANTAIGSMNGTVFNATPAVGQNNLENTAYSFNGTSAYMSFPLTNLPDVMDSITISVWAKPTAASTSGIIYTNTTDNANLINTHLPYTGGTLMYWDFGSTSAGRVSGTFPSSALNNWSLWTFTASPSTGTRIYQNGALLANSATSATFTKGSKTMEVGRNYTGPTYWTGSLDDYRIYNRALTSGEIQALYAAGAQ